MRTISPAVQSEGNKPPRPPGRAGLDMDDSIRGLGDAIAGLSPHDAAELRDWLRDEHLIIHGDPTAPKPQGVMYGKDLIE